MATEAQSATLPGPSRVAGLASALASTSGLRRLAVALGFYLLSLAVFGAVVATQHADPFAVYWSIVKSALFETGSIDQILLRAVPLVLAMGACAFAAGAIWGAVPAVLRVVLGANESVSTLLLNFIANDILLYLLYQPWKDPGGTGQPQSKPLQTAAQLPGMLGGLNLGVIVVLVAVIAVYLILRYSGWGFALRVVGGNPEAARRAGLPVKRLMVSAMAAGGGLAGLGGMLYLAGTQQQLLPGGTASFGYTAFLAAFLGRQGTIRVVLSALLFSAIAISAPGLQLGYGLDGNAVDILLALTVAAPLALSSTRRKAV